MTPLLLSSYERRARLIPGLVALLPISVTLGALGWSKIPVIATIGAVLVAAGGPMILAHFVGDRGRAAQAVLVAAWKGFPTTKLLRLSEAAENAKQRDVWREALEAYTGASLLDADAERSAPKEADDAIGVAVAQVRHFGFGDKADPRAAAENAQYGLERNIYGIRVVARVLAIVCMASATFAACHAGFHNRAADAGAGIDALIFIFWVFVPSAGRTEEAGKRYAARLFDAVVTEVRRTASGGASPTEASAG